MGRSGRKTAKARQKSGVSDERTRKYRQLRHPFIAQSVFSQDAIDTMHAQALKVLETLGMKILLAEARALFKGAGARVHEEMVFIGSDIVTAALRSAPKTFRLRCVNPAFEQQFENGAMIFSPGSGCPNTNDLVRGRQPGSLQAYEETLKLQQSFDVIHKLGPSAEPQDVSAHLRHYAMMRAQLTLCEKPMFVYSRGSGQVEQSFEMIQLALGLGSEDFEQGVWASTVINTNSPRQLDVPMAQGVIDFARANQLSIITPFCLAGAMAPITIAGALVLQHAEALAGITLAQLAKPGAPVAYGGFGSNVDMKSGAPAFGTPEHLKCSIGSGQLARHIGLPWRSAGGSASNVADMQSSTEQVMSLWGALMANATLTVHSAGWLEGGLVFGYEKFINDVEALQMLAELCTLPEAEEASFAWSALEDVEPGGHFFATQHTMERYRDAFYPPLVADLNNYGGWVNSGSKTSTERATEIWQAVLRDFQHPSHGGGADEVLVPYIERGTKAGGAPPVS